jgi:hypothetical protein
MSVALVTESGLHESFRRHLTARVEQAGFFLADHDAGTRSLTLRTWRPVPAEEFEGQSDFHLTLRDEVRADIIKWAWDNHACLVEAHSHGAGRPASFSPSDVWGLDEWVPHLWWRLRGRPYAAIVLAGDTFDALAWIDGADAPEQVEHLAVDNVRHLPTGRTLPRLGALREWTRGG